MLGGGAFYYNCFSWSILVKEFWIKKLKTTITVFLFQFITELHKFQSAANSLEIQQVSTNSWIQNFTKQDILTIIIKMSKIMLIRTKLERQHGRQAITKLIFLYDFWFNKLNRNSKNLKNRVVFFFSETRKCFIYLPIKVISYKCILMYNGCLERRKKN